MLRSRTRPMIPCDTKHSGTPKSLRPGGFGVLLARHLVDELIYGEKGNEVLLLKYLDLSELCSAQKAEQSSGLQLG
jgi:hypothetical protein